MPKEGDSMSVINIDLSSSILLAIVAFSFMFLFSFNYDPNGAKAVIKQNGAGEYVLMQASTGNYLSAQWQEERSRFTSEVTRALLTTVDHLEMLAPGLGFTEVELVVSAAGVV